jgi:hypothetical protein
VPPDVAEEIETLSEALRNSSENVDLKDVFGDTFVRVPVKPKLDDADDVRFRRTKRTRLDMAGISADALHRLAVAKEKGSNSARRRKYALENHEALTERVEPVGTPKTETPVAVKTDGGHSERTPTTGKGQGERAQTPRAEAGQGERAGKSQGERAQTPRAEAGQVERTPTTGKSQGERTQTPRAEVGPVERTSTPKGEKGQGTDGAQAARVELGPTLRSKRGQGSKTEANQGSRNERLPGTRVELSQASRTEGRQTPRNEKVKRVSHDVRF